MPSLPVPTCYATPSIGAPDTPLRSKLEAISQAGFEGIELGFPDLLSFAKEYHDDRKDQSSLDSDYDALCEAAGQVKAICEDLKLKIVMMQPFANFEGWDEGSKEREDAFTRAKGWIRIMGKLGCDMIQVRVSYALTPWAPTCGQRTTLIDTKLTQAVQVGSSDSPHMNTDRTKIVNDLQTFSALLAPHNFRLAYENWCWSTHAPDWSDVWDIVRRVDRPNVGLCLDTFQTAGGEWADPTTPSGLREDVGGGSREELEARYTKSLEELARMVPKEKIYILQISDGYKTRLNDEVDEGGKRPRAQWSSCLRPMPFDGGYLPIVEMARAVMETGFRGWWSMEVFDGGEDGTRMGKEEWKDMDGFARRAMGALERLVDEAG